MRPLGASSVIASSTDLPVYAVILAGGRGERLWPRARRRRPKPFVPLLGGRTLFEATASRARALAGRHRVLVVCGAGQAGLVRRHAAWIDPERIIREGVGRNTAASVALAALWVERRARDAVVVILPADHFVSPRHQFLAAVRRAARAVVRRPGLAVLGVKVAGPDTGFGYIGLGRSAGLPGVRLAAGFREKPPAPVAARLVRGGRHLWNCGIFVGRASALLGELQALAPRVLGPLSRFASEARIPWTVPRRVLMTVPAIPFDRAVLERTRGLMVVPAHNRWSDLGTWSALAGAADRRGAPAGEGAVIARQSRGCVAFNAGGLTAFVGVNDLVLVRDGDVVLVCRRDASQGVREVVRRLRGSLARHA